MDRPGSKDSLEMSEGRAAGIWPGSFSPARKDFVWEIRS